jgi:hypothetical protein
MPTARELLEQADALMRRNRAADTSIPVLTDAVEPPRAVAAPAGARSGTTISQAMKAQRGEPMGQPSATRQALSIEPPVLTDAVEELAVDIPPAPAEQLQGEPSLWLGPDTIDPALHSITGPAPPTTAVVPPVTLRAPEAPVEPVSSFDDPDPTVTRTLRAAGSAGVPPPAHSAPSWSAQPEAAESTVGGAGSAAADEERWRALAEQITMQVLQRIDIFTDTGLKAQLAKHLEPIVADAGRELVEAINDHVGQLVRSYVAEAIEREIAQWRAQQH